MADGTPVEGSDDLDSWLTRLACDEPADPALGDLRTLIALEGQRAEDGVLGQLASPQAELRAVERLRARLAEARPAPTSETTRPPWFTGRVRWAVPVFCALLLALGLPLYQGLDRGGPEPLDEVPPTTRSAIQLIPVKDAAPLKRAQRIAAALKPLVDGLVLYAHGDRVALDVEIDAANLAGAVSAARAVGDEAIAPQLRPGTNRIEVTRP